MATNKSTKKLKPSKSDLFRWSLRTLVIRDLQRKLDPKSLRLNRSTLKKAIQEEADDVSLFGLSRGQMDRLVDKMFPTWTERR